MQWVLSENFKAEVLNFIDAVFKISKVLGYSFEIEMDLKIILYFLWDLDFEWEFERELLFC